MFQLLRASTGCSTYQLLSLGHETRLRCEMEPFLYEASRTVLQTAIAQVISLGTAPTNGPAEPQRGGPTRVSTELAKRLQHASCSGSR